MTDWPGDNAPLPHAAREDRLGARLAGMVAPLRAITVRQPWAWAIVHGGKNVENRSRNIAGSYRGPVLIHAGQGWSDEGERSEQVARAYFESRRRQGWDAVGEEAATKRATAAGLGRFVLPDHHGAFVGTADLVSVHHDSDHGPYRCSDWALSGDWHLMLENAQPLPEPIPARGMLGLWTPTAEQREQITGALA